MEDRIEVQTGELTDLTAGVNPATRDDGAAGTPETGS